MRKVNYNYDWASLPVTDVMHVKYEIEKQRHVEEMIAASRARVKLQNMKWQK